jgi:hypothetical protein
LGGGHIAGDRRGIDRCAADSWFTWSHQDSQVYFTVRIFYHARSAPRGPAQKSYPPPPRKAIAPRFAT